MEGMKKLYSELLEHFEKSGYTRLSPDAEGAAPIYGIFDKTNMYLVRILTPEIEETVSGRGKVQPGPNVHADKVVVLNLHLVEDGTMPEFKNETPDLEARVIDVHWVIRVDLRELFIPKKQLKGIMKLDRELVRLLNKESQDYYHLHRRVDQPTATYLLMGINVVFWLFLEWAGGSTDLDVLVRYGAVQRSLVVGQGEYWRLMTSMFIHIGIGHLALNTFSLYIFGTRIEMYMKRWQYVAMYITSGVAGSVMSVIGNGWIGRNPVSAGASGAIYGILGSVMVFSKLTRRSLDGVNAHMIWIIFMVGIVYAAWNPEIGGFAHVGGFLAGAIISLFLMGENKLGSRNSIK